MSSVDDDQETVEPTSKPLSQADKEQVFRIATRGFVHSFGDQFADGMSDGALWKALQEGLGIFGGTSGPGRLAVTYGGAGLKIWGSWTAVNHVTAAPLFSGNATLAMAREVYSIANPKDDQLSLL